MRGTQWAQVTVSKHIMGHARFVVPSKVVFGAWIRVAKDLMDIHTNHNSKKMTILNQLFLELNIAIAIK